MELSTSHSLPDSAPPQLFEHFLSLPAELRLNIYRHALVDPASYIITIANLPPCRPHKSKPLCVALLRTCKLVYNEALPVLYQENTWMIRSFPPKRCVPEQFAFLGEDSREKCAELIRRVFTIWPLASKGCRLDLDGVKERLGAMGVVWEKLHVWAVRTTEIEEVERWEDECGEWLERVGEKRMEGLGLRPKWWDFGDRVDVWWACKKDSKGVGEMRGFTS